MDLVLFLVIVVYIGGIFSCARRFVIEEEGKSEEKVNALKERLRHLEGKKEALDRKKTELQAEATDIFTLYEITKDITKTLHEKEAFGMFKKKLEEHVRLVDCQFLDLQNEDIDNFRKDPDYFIFSLKTKDQNVGHLVVKGVSEDEKEKMAILATQFSLALRRVKLYQEIEQIAITDSLTEVRTRRYTMERLQEEMNRSKSQHLNLAVLMVDVDHFKKINDTYGHLTGDQVLSEIGRIIKENLREIDIAGRYGGEEFCVVLPDTSAQGAQFAAERIRQATEKALIKAYDTQLQTSVSIGISQFPKDGTKLSELVDKADWALYRAKKQGRNRVCSFGVYQED
ncbi:MAG TPA: GGDEF domain-containing protein [Candidatus Omnitrophota bacterium]|nr:GGDEF domain-containing protein [Candidatus Omnitrophota bacterium]